MIDERILLGIPGMDNARAVEHIAVNDLTGSMFQRRFVDRNVPLLVKGALKEWPAYRKWRSVQYLSEIGQNADINFYRHLNYSNGNSMKRAAKKRPFAEALDEFHSGVDEVLFMPVYLEKGEFQKLKADINEFAFLPSPRKPLYYPASRIFIYKGAGSGWHLHVVDETLMCQLAGQKRVAMIPSTDGNYECLKEVFYSDALLDDPTRLQHLQGAIKPFVVDVDPGDALYIPPHWWHGVQPIEDSVGITMPSCWRSPLHKLSNLRYPDVRDLWKDAYRRPGLPMLAMPVYGLVTLLAQIARRVNGGGRVG